MELFAYILAPFIASGALYLLGKKLVDSIWYGLLTLLGKSGALADKELQEAMYHLVSKG
jgi:hypothetical protein